MKRLLENTTCTSALTAILAVLALSAVSTPVSANPRKRAACVESALRTPLVNAWGFETRALEEISELKVMTFNALSLGQMVGKYERMKDGTMVLVRPGTALDAEQVAARARVILDENPDVALLQEVEGGLERLQAFNDSQLNRQYSSYLVAGNDTERNINIGLLIKRDLPITVEMRTNRAETWVDPIWPLKKKRLFARDVPVAIIRRADRPKNDDPLMVIAGRHGKSMRFRLGDPDSVVFREAEVKRTEKILAQLHHEFGPDVRLILGGDFNMPVSDPRMKQGLEKLGMKEGFDLSPKPVPEEDRITHTYHPLDAAMEKSQLDGFFLARGLHSDVKEVRVYRYKDKDGNPFPLPTTYEERQLNPSDHFPVVLTLDFRSIVRKHAESVAAKAVRSSVPKVLPKPLPTEHPSGP